MGREERRERREAGLSKPYIYIFSFFKKRRRTAKFMGENPVSAKAVLMETFNK